MTGEDLEKYLAPQKKSGPAHSLFFASAQKPIARSVEDAKESHLKTQSRFIEAALDLPNALASFADSIQPCRGCYKKGGRGRSIFA